MIIKISYDLYFNKNAKSVCMKKMQIKCLI